MRVVSSTLAAAITAVERTTRLKAAIDWDGDGYNTVDSSDPFTRVLASGWGYSALGYPWVTTGTGTVLATDHQVTGTAAVQLVPVNSNYRIAYVNPLTYQAQDQDVTVEWSCPAPTGGDLEPSGIVVRGQNHLNYVLCRVVLSPGGPVKVAIFRLVAAVETVLLDPTVVPGLTYTSSVHWYTRVQAIGTRIRIKTWPAGTTEPVGWHATAYDDTWSQGTWGIRSGIGFGNTNSKPVTFTSYDARVATSTVDDISEQLGSLSITRDMTGQLPAEVLVVEGISAATADGELVKGDPRDENLNAVRYFSRSNPSSPLYGKDRANRDARVAVEFRTDAGWESAPRLTGAVLRALPVDAKSGASLSLIDARDRFRKPITLPGVIAEQTWDGVTTIPTMPGLEASWLVSYALSQCGYPLAPAPRAECRLYIPMHGSAVPFVQTPHSGAPAAKYEPVDGQINPRRIPFSDDAPFFLAADPTGDDDGYLELKAPVNAIPPDGWDANGRAIGVRIEAWVKITGAEPGVDATMVAVYTDTLTDSSRAYLYVRADGQIIGFLSNDGNTVFVSGPTISVDVWTFVGIHFDDVNGRCIVRVDGTSTTYTPGSTTAGGFSPSVAVACDVKSWARIAEVHVSMCDEATAWPPITHTSGAVVDRLQNRLLQGIYPDKPVEAWQLLQDVAGAEFGLVRIDYDGRPTVWSAARRLTADSLVTVRTLTAKTDLVGLGYDDSRDMIRNLIRVPYAQITSPGAVPIWSLTALEIIAPGETKTYLVKVDPLASSILTLAGSADLAANGTGPGNYTFTTIIGQDQIGATVTLTSPTSVTITITNRLPATVWLVDDGGIPNLILSGVPLKKEDTEPVEDTDATSRERYGDAVLDDDDNPWVQGPAFARGRAAQLLALLRDEQVVYTDISVPGDPRLEPLDRIRVQDNTGLVLDTELLIEGVDDDFPSVGYDMSLVGRPARDQHVWGGVGVGTPIGSTILGGPPVEEVEPEEPPAILSAGPDASMSTGSTFSRTATEPPGATISARTWTIVSGPTGAGTTIGTAAALSWVPGSTPGGLSATDIRHPVFQEMAYQFSSTAENSTLVWNGEYDYIEDILDGRGYTAGLVGFTSATGDMLDMVEQYQILRLSGNPLAPFLDGLEACAAYGDTVDDAVYGVDGGGASDIAASELGSAFETAWANAASTDPLFRQAQLNYRQTQYWAPALAAALADGVGALGLALYYDTSINHGHGVANSNDGSFTDIRSRTTGTKPINGGNQRTWLRNWISVRSAVLTDWGDNPADGRIAAWNAITNPTTPDYMWTSAVSWSMYGTPFSMNRPAVTVDSIRGTYVLRYTATGTGGGTDDVTVTVT